MIKLRVFRPFHTEGKERFSDVCRFIWFLPPATKLGQGNIFRSMCQEFCSQGGGLPHCMLGYTPPPGPEADTPRDQTPPNTRGRTPPPGPEAGPLGPDPPTPSAVHAGRYGHQAGSKHPTGMKSCYCRQRSWCKVIFSEACVKNCSQGGMRGRGHAWQGGVYGRGHAWQGGMHGRGACVAGRRAWQGVCMAGRVCGWWVCVAGGVRGIRSMSGRYAS